MNNLRFPVSLSRTAFFLLAILFVASCAEPEPEKPPRDYKTAAITWKSLISRDTSFVGDTLDRHFVFYNSGWKPIRILSAKSTHPGCSCTAPTREIPIGEQDTIFARCIFKTEGHISGVFKVKDNSKNAEYSLILKSVVSARNE